MTKSSKESNCILVVDDDDMLRSYVKELLKLNNFIVSEAADGKAGLKEFKENIQNLLGILVL